ncbi:MAG: cytochrome c oxidase assembly protein [Steroidobacteraceae bacterium]
MSALGVSVARWLLPWEFSPTAFTICAVSLALYLRGVASLSRRGDSPGAWRQVAFFTGLALDYAALQTYFDYLSQHMFWVHRLQHLVLHHIAPVLLVLAAPGPVMSLGLPRALRERVLEPLARQSALRWPMRLLQNPLMATLLFVGLIYYWLTPSVHFAAMLDVHRYLLMNWSMAVDGLLFWWLILVPRGAQGLLAVGYGTRFVILCASALLQILLGAYITLHTSVLFDVYGLCGRAWAVSALVDQQLGGLLTWIPPAMMSLAGVLIVLHHALRDSELARPRPPAPIDYSLGVAGR